MTGAQKRAYQREWLRARRAEWFDGKCCLNCRGVDRLEIHHRDPATKVHHAIWSWSDERREAELAKCDVLCRPCHEAVHWPPKPPKQDAREAVQAWLAEWDRRKAKRRRRVLPRTATAAKSFSSDPSGI